MAEATTPTSTTPSTGHQGPSRVPQTHSVTWFTTEIQQMMHGFGDCRKPLVESALLIEDVTRQQMTRLLYQAEEIARQRNARFIGIEDFLFLLRRDKNKLRRLIRCMDLKDMKALGNMRGSYGDDDDSEQETKQPMKKRKKVCYDFLSTIDQTGELIALFDDSGFDEIKHERALRAELQTRHMDARQYMEYCESRQASFTPKYRSQKFKEWLVQGMALEIKPNALAVEVLSYLAYETVAQVVDLTLLVRRDQRVQVDDPFTQEMPPVCINHDSLQAFQIAASSGGASALKSPATTRSGSPPASPPSTPTTPTQGPNSTSASNSGSQNTSRSRSKKRKKTGSGQYRDLYSSHAITTSDIREAMRRFLQPSGPFATAQKEPCTTSRQRLLCV